MHISLDGFVAGPNGEMDWIKANEEIFEYVAKRIINTDTALYGRVTYQMMESYWPTAAEKPNTTKHTIEHSAWYRDAHKIVLSTTLQENNVPNITIISDNISENISKIKQTPGKEILLFGSPKATHELIHQNLIDGYWLFVNPVILGEGIPLFSGINEKIKLKLVSPAKQFSSGVTELNYEVEKN